jgi:hypothetical protein
MALQRLKGSQVKMQLIKLALVGKEIVKLVLEGPWELLPLLLLVKLRNVLARANFPQERARVEFVPDVLALPKIPFNRLHQDPDPRAVSTAWFWRVAPRIGKASLKQNKGKARIKPKSHSIKLATSAS